MSERADRLRQARAAAGFDGPGEAAARFGWNPNTYKSNENGNAPFSFKKAKEYAAAFGVRAEWLYDASGPALGEPSPPSLPRLQSTPGDPVNLSDLRAYLGAMPERPTERPAGKLRPIVRRIPVMGEVAAGLWREAVPRQMEDAHEWLDMDVKGYERARLQAMRVVGPSMDLVYPPGRYVVIAHPAEAGLRHGDYVVVERTRPDLVELTLKEFVVEEDGRVALWPRSSHPDFQTPFYLSPTNEAEQIGLQIIGVVVADYGKRDRPPIAYERSA
jgi:SOS-response transcriptional repressor LexA